MQTCVRTPILILAVLLVAAVAGPAKAVIVNVVVIETRGSDVPFALSYQRDESSGDPPDDVSRSLGLPDRRASASLDRFGNLALTGSLFGSGSLAVGAGSRATFVNPLPVPRRAFSRVIVDGGELRLLGPVDARIDLEVNVFVSDFATSQVVERTIPVVDLSLAMDADFGSATLVNRTGDPADAPADDPFANGVQLLPSLVEIDLGTIPANAVFDVGYGAEVTATTSGPTEFLSFTYLDPLSVIFEEPTFAPVDAVVPLPGSALLLLPGLVGLAALRRRRPDV